MNIGKVLPTIYLDSCAFWPPQNNEKMAMDKLWDLEEKDIIQMEVAEATSEEMERAPDKLKNKMNGRLISAEAIDDNPQEVRRLFEIKALLFPNKQKLADNEIRDARNLFCAQKYGPSLFVTVDSCHILKKADVIKERLGIRVITPAQCLKIISE